MQGAMMARASTHDYFQFNEIGEGGARELARALEQNSCITHLNVSVCWRKEGDECMAAGWHLYVLMIACRAMG